MNQRRIYMAGKISKGDWRSRYYGRNSDLYEQLLDTPGVAEWEPVPFDNHLYTGPFFVSCDHGCYHGNNTHGVGAPGDDGIETSDGDWYGVGCGPRGMKPRHVVSQCQLAIHRSNTFFAWIDADDCYGTIAELGYARLIVPDIWVAGPEPNPDMWFIYEMASDTAFGFNSPHDALNHFLKKHDKLDYHEYIRSPEWREKAEAAKERAGQRCQVCNRPRTEVTLDAHHRTYERLGREMPEDITVLCRDCHELYETNKRNGTHRS